MDPMDDISEGDALADFMTAFYGNDHETLRNEDDIGEASNVDAINPEWVNLEKDGKTPLYPGSTCSR
jgi:hypothetical protein